jgi:hypothetical protein
LRLSILCHINLIYQVYATFSFSVNMTGVNWEFDKDKSHSKFLSQPKFEYKNRSEHEEYKSKNTLARDAGTPNPGRKPALMLRKIALFRVLFSTSPTGSRNHLASFRFQNTFRLNVLNRDGDRWFSDPVGEVLSVDRTRCET